MCLTPPSTNRLKAVEGFEIAARDKKEQGRFMRCCAMNRLFASCHAECHFSHSLYVLSACWEEVHTLEEMHRAQELKERCLNIHSLTIIQLQA